VILTQSRNMYRAIQKILVMNLRVNSRSFYCAGNLSRQVEEQDIKRDLRV
jgi:hypothetical protein